MAANDAPDDSHALPLSMNDDDVDTQRSPKRQKLDMDTSFGGGMYNSRGDYFRQKSLKQQENFLKVAPIISNIFQDVVVYATGLVNVQDIRNVVVSHSGRWETYDYTPATHIICEGLPDAKVKAWRGRKVMRKEWITDSVKEGKKLCEDKYLVIGPGLDAMQKTLSFNHVTNVAVVRSPNIQNHDSPTKKSLSCTDPEFIKNYFASSRLSHIGIFRSVIHELVMNDALFPRESHQPSTSQPSVYFHVDVDCFFAQVSLLSRPELKHLPVVICHSSSISKTQSNSTSEVSCPNYPARAFGIKAGTFLRTAKEKCPDLITLPYNYLEYNRITCLLYKTLCKYCSQDDIDAISCDEVIINVSSCVYSQTEHFPNRIYSFAEKLRHEIYATTGCFVSIGVGASKYLCRLSTKIAKKEKQRNLSQDTKGIFCLIHKSYYSNQFMIETLTDIAYADCWAEYYAKVNELSLGDIDGIGWSLQHRLSDLNYSSVSDVVILTKEELIKILSDQSDAEKVFSHIHGNPASYHVKNAFKDPKSIGAEISWGIRFSNNGQVKTFLGQLWDEVNRRWQATFPATIDSQHTVVFQKITINGKKRKGTSEPTKFLGHGRCDNFTKSIDYNNHAGASVVDIVWSIFQQLKIAAEDIRGLGLRLSHFRKNDAPSVLNHFPKKTVSNINISPTHNHNHYRHNQPNVGIMKSSTRRDNKFHPDSFIPESWSQCDPEMLKNIPADVIRELEQQFGKVRPSEPTHLPSKTVANTNHIEYFSENRELRQSFHYWLREEKATPENLRVVIGLAVNYISHRRILDAQQFLRCFHRLTRPVSSGADGAWSKCWSDIHAAVQSVMMAEFGGTLDIPSCGDPNGRIK